MGKVEFMIQTGEKSEYPLHLAQQEHREVLVLQEEGGEARFDISLGTGASLDLTVVSLACNAADFPATGDGYGNDIPEAVGKPSIEVKKEKVIRNTFSVNLNNQDAVCNLNGVYLVDGSNKVVNNVAMNHNVGHCISNQLFRGILWDKSRSDFEGRIYVAQDAQKTEAYQANNNIVESEQARAHTQPHLEIYADDVKCSHGATVGNKESGELFYMQSRGISLANAKVLLKQAFLLGVLEKISDDDLKEEMSLKILSSSR